MGINIQLQIVVWVAILIWYATAVGATGGKHASGTCKGYAFCKDPRFWLHLWTFFLFFQVYADMNTSIRDVFHQACSLRRQHPAPTTKSD